MSTELLDAFAMLLVLGGAAIGVMGMVFSLIVGVEVYAVHREHVKKPIRWHGNLVIWIMIAALVHLLGVELLNLFVKP